LSQNVTDAPLIRVAKGNFSLWSSNERWQCRWEEEKSGSSGYNNGNDSTKSGISASSNPPSKSSAGLGSYDYVARVKVCASTALVNSESCKEYKQTLKPTGLLQTYGDTDKIYFGLMTGSYGKNKSGGVLRKNIGTMTDEINVTTDGTFKSTPTAGGIINTLDKLRTYGYRHDEGTYFGTTTGSDDCAWGLNTFSNGSCSNWGNPQAEILLGSLRYLAGKTASSAFNVDDSSRITGLTTATAVDPIASNKWCSPLNIVQFNASTTSYDGDELSAVTDIGASGMDTLTDTVGVGENIPNHSYFIGENGTDNNQLCTAKTITDLSSVRGTCPDSPRLSGSYHISGLAHYAHTNTIRTDRKGPQNTAKQLVTTYGVALSPAIPKVVVTVPGTTKTISILPACRDSSVGGNCTIVDFKIVSQTVASSGSDHSTGKLYVNWEDSEQGGDFDQDEWGVINYDVSSSQVIITTDVIAQSTPYAMGFGYIISGTDKDGFHAHSGINSFNYNDPASVTGCSNCKYDDIATSVTYSIGSSSASSLQQPLFYAAKWGGFNDTDKDNKPNLTPEWDVINNTTGLAGTDGIPDRYFAATNPKELATSLGKALADVIQTSSSSASVAANSSSLNINSVIYQAKFNTNDWTGQLLAYPIVNGAIASTFTWDAGKKVTAQGMDNRSIFSYNPTGVTGAGTTLTTKGISFNWANLNATQQALLTQNQVNYLRGDQSNEGTTAGKLRARSGTNALLGDLINSDPLYISSARDFGYYLLPNPEGSSYLTFRGSTKFQARTPILAIGGNDGMLHVFNANITGTGNGNELFAYVPHTILSNLSALTSPSYSHKYFVDGSPVASDAYFNAGGTIDNEWRTVLVETLGAGGKGIFALDVTFLDPADATYATAETAFAANRVLWEINDQSAPTASDLTDDLTGAPKRYGFTKHLGSTLGQASIVRMANGSFAAVFGNGYNSVNQKAVLYIVDIKTGALIRSISTETGDTNNPNGLATPITVDVNGDRIVDAIYAGDLKGNLWKFDVSSGTASNWDVAFKTGTTPNPLFIAKDSLGTVQPITTKPQVGLDPLKSGAFGVVVYMGTGKYFETGDNVVPSSPQTQTFYGIKDPCVKRAGTSDTCSSTSPNAIRSELVQQSMLAQNTSAGATSYHSYTTADNNKKGWYMDLLTPPSTAAGERVVSQAQLKNGIIIFVAITPNGAACAHGGTSILMALDALTGNRLDNSFDLTGDGLVNSRDQVTLVDTNNDGVVDTHDTSTSASYVIIGGVLGKPTAISGDGDILNLVTNSSDTNPNPNDPDPDPNPELKIHKLRDPGIKGRLSWRQLR
ncbi:MAG: hypothetical protein LUQ11_03645, partial [Methylococcaceae bacterium]|nr:hypothetical protein [Methylococcaceae bacterium]